MKKDYQARLAAEIKHYRQIFKDSLLQPVPPVWNSVEERFAKQVETAVGVRGLPEYIARHVKGRKRVKVLSLGSGACGVELEMVGPLLKKQGTEMELVSLDINQEILEKAGKEAGKRGIKFVGMVQDINRLSLEEEKYEVVIAFAALHHFENLTRVAKEINKTLKPKGIFVTVDIPTRNGYLMWDETRALVERIWRVLPRRYRWDHTVTKVPVLMNKYPDVDYSIGSMECANSEAIVPALRKHLTEVAYIPAFAFARRFFDTKFGPNFDLRKGEAKAWFELLMNLDEQMIAAKALKPETFFGAYRKKSHSDK